MSDQLVSPPRPTIGCVSFLNARPLIDRLASRPDVNVRFAVPSALLSELERDAVGVALCPVIDYQMSRQPLVIVPVGGIGCFGPTLTVRLYSRVPIERITTVHADMDSHSSVALMRIVLRDAHGRSPRVIDYRAAGANINERDDIEAALLIGDKVVTAAPHDETFSHQLDLGESWKRLTGLPFVFAVWMAKHDTALGDLPELLDAERRANAGRIDEITAAHAERVGWEPGLARHYLGGLLRYGIGERELEAMRRFWQRAHELGLTPHHRPLRLYQVGAATVPAG